ncbi:MAG: NYN domain-containing protein [Deltaproteobacteria bacterium]|nr:NYN domain-containing protein [Deltaproteobacteria bacterium]
MDEEVAVFIDFENLRYGLLNYHGIEPDLQALVEKARKYGRPSIMRAYADFSEHPSELNRALQVAGIEAINIPVKRTTYDKGGKSVERVKNAADMVLALDAVLEAIEAYTARRNKVFLLVSGDRDYVKLVTILRNRYGQRVVIAGVPGQVAGDLVAAAGGEKDPIEIKQVPKADKYEIKEAIVKMVKKGPAPLIYWSVRVIDQWAQDSRHNIPGTAKDRRDAISELLSEQVITRKTRTNEKGGQVSEAILDEAKAQELKYL